MTDVLSKVVVHGWIPYTLSNNFQQQATVTTIQDGVQDGRHACPLGKDVQIVVTSSGYITQDH